jgi:hypothetical protein
MNILVELLDWFTTRSKRYQVITPHVNVASDFLNDTRKEKITFPVTNLSDLTDNVVDILILTGGPTLDAKKDLEEIYSIAFEIYNYLSNKDISNE